ncbi:MAG TPA: nuclear transport factor 2 family protein [Rubellimicrobium sp.]|nr:nuclear transport factor 2 family protein [Rubellimicrobium sp.]
MTIQRKLAPDLGARTSALAQGTITEGDLVALFERASDAHAALIGGEVSRYFEMVAPAPDLVLMTPVGGFTRRSEPFSPAEMEGMTRFFRGGSGTAELVGSYASGDLAVLVMIERARARIADIPDQDWALRVTLVFRRGEEGWRLVHRHADPLVAQIGWGRSAELARG